MTKLICIMKNGSLEIGTMEEIIEKVRKKIISSLEKEELPEKENVVNLYRKIKSKKSSLADILDAEEMLKDILYQPEFNIDAEFGYNKIRPSYKIFKLEGDITELRLAFKYYGDIRSDIAYNAGYDAGYDAKL